MSEGKQLFDDASSNQYFGIIWFTVLPFVQEFLPEYGEDCQVCYSQSGDDFINFIMLSRIELKH